MFPLKVNTPYLPILNTHSSKGALLASSLSLSTVPNDIDIPNTSCISPSFLTLLEFFPNYQGISALNDSDTSVPCHLIYQIGVAFFDERFPTFLNGYNAISCCYVIVNILFTLFRCLLT